MKEYRSAEHTRVYRLFPKPGEFFIVVSSCPQDVKAINAGDAGPLEIGILA